MMRTVLKPCSLELWSMAMDAPLSALIIFIVSPPLPSRKPTTPCSTQNSMAPSARLVGSISASLVSIRAFACSAACGVPKICAMLKPLSFVLWSMAMSSTPLFSRMKRSVSPPCPMMKPTNLWSIFIVTAGAFARCSCSCCRCASRVILAAMAACSAACTAAESTLPAPLPLPAMPDWDCIGEGTPNPSAWDPSMDCVFGPGPCGPGISGPCPGIPCQPPFPCHPSCHPGMPCMLGSCPGMPCQLDPCIFGPCPGMPCQLDPCMLGPWPGMPCQLGPCMFGPCPGMPCQLGPCMFGPCPGIPCPAMCRSSACPCSS
mmetsp:Transcript_52719/g.136099  ORF Transcript_52719/g.136099 Transcript_52719/m.136099 type:complete len:316 (-) Transcript_52719:225-1172(-)